MWNLQHTNNEDRSKKTPAFKKWGVLYSGITWMQKLRKTASSTPSNEPDVPTPEAVGLKSITAKNKPNRWKRLLSATRTESYRNIDPIYPASKPPRQNTGQQYFTPGTPSARLLKSASVGDYARLVPRAEVNTSLRGFSTTNQPEQTHSFSYSSGLPNRAPAENVNPLFWPSHGNPLPSPSLDVHKLAFLQKSEDSTVDRTDCESTLEPSDSSQGIGHQFGSQTGSTGATKSMSGSAQPDANDSESMESRENQEEMKNIMHRERRRAVIEDDNFQWNSEEETSDAGSAAAAVESETSTSKSTGELVSSVGFFGGQRRGLLRKQRTVAELLARSQTLNASSEFDTKRRKKAILKLAESRSRSKDLFLDIGEALSKLTPSTFTDTYLESFRNSHWSQLTTSGSVPATEEGPTPTRREVLRREAVWELFKSELIFFTDHLLVLKNCFMEPLKKLQVDGYLMFVEPSDLYGNLDDLCYVSHSLCRELLGNLSRDSRVKDFGNTNVLLQTLKRWSEHSRDGEVYHTYCLNYDSALVYLDTLRTNEQFTEYERWCEQDPRCRRLQLTDLLVAPIQHYMKIPLMLTGIRGYTADKAEQDMLQNCLEKVDKALKSLENKMQWLKSFERLQEIQTQLVWPSVSELEPKVFIPDCLKPKVAKQPCERLIATPRRNLLHEGPLTLIDGNKVIETYTFLFDDFLLLTKVKKHPKKNIGDDAVYIVHRQAIALDRFMLHELSSAEEHANYLRHAIVLVLLTRFQQIINVYTLQAPSEQDKNKWIGVLRFGQQRFQLKLKYNLYGTENVRRRSRNSDTLVNNKMKVIHSTKPEEFNAQSHSVSPRPLRHPTCVHPIPNSSQIKKEEDDSLEEYSIKGCETKMVGRYKSSDSGPNEQSHFESISRRGLGPVKFIDADAECGLQLDRLRQQYRAGTRDSEDKRTHRETISGRASPSMLTSTRCKTTSSPNSSAFRAPSLSRHSIANPPRIHELNSSENVMQTDQQNCRKKLHQSTRSTATLPEVAQGNSKDYHEIGGSI